MTTREISETLGRKFGSGIVASFPEDKHPRIHVNATEWREMAEFLRGEAGLRFDWLANLSGVDYIAEEKMCVVYDLYSFELRHAFAVKVYCARNDPRVPSVCDLWPAANWHEREAFDLLGIVFEGHPDPRRILCDDDWVGHPLRKDYVFPEEFHGIPAAGDGEGKKPASKDKI